MLKKIISFVTAPFRRQIADIWDTSRATNAALLKDWNKGRAKAIALEERFVTANGDVYYTHANIADLGRIREAKLRELMLKAAFNVTPARIAEYEQRLSAANDAKDKELILKLSTRLISDMKAAPEVLTLCELGALLVFRHDERPDVFNPVIHADKVKQSQLDPNAQFFFAYTGWAILAESGMEGKLAEWRLTSDNDIQDYLQAAAEKATAKPPKRTT